QNEAYPARGANIENRSQARKCVWLSSDGCQNIGVSKPTPHPIWRVINNLRCRVKRLLCDYTSMRAPEPCDGGGAGLLYRVECAQIDQSLPESAQRLVPFA